MAFMACSGMRAVTTGRSAVPDDLRVLMSAGAEQQAEVATG